MLVENERVTSVTGFGEGHSAATYNLQPPGEALLTSTMYAAKRKFHNLLESVTSPYTPQSSSIPEPEPKTIREKLEARIKRQRLQNTSTRDKRASTVATTGGNPILRGTTVVELKSAPNFAPWDRSQFLDRLKTFRHVDKWSAKPRTVDEVQWSKRGWVCVGPERVKCQGGCGRELVVKLERAEGDATEDDGEGEEQKAQAGAFSIGSSS